MRMFVVLDTNIYLHFKSFEEIPWKDELGYDDITILVPSVVVEEVDRKKDNERGKVQKRARAVSRRLGELLIDEKPGKYPLVFVESPYVTEEERRQFLLDRNDNLILYSVEKAGYETKDVCIVSSDTGMLIRAKQKGFRWLRLDEKYRLSDELTKEEKEGKEAKAELERLRNRHPAPQLVFAGCSSHLQITRPEKRDIDALIAQRMNEIREQWPRMTPENVMDLVKGYPIRTVPQSRMDEYNLLLDDFLRQSETKIRLEIARDELKHRMVLVPIHLSNLGTAATGKTNIFLTIQEGIQIYCDEKKRKFTYEKPNPPSLFPEVRGVDSVIEIWDLDKYEKKFDFSVAAEPLTHNLGCEVFTFFVDSAKCPNFKILWRIADSELPDLVTGVLNVSFIDADQVGEDGEE